MSRDWRQIEDRLLNDVPTFAALGFIMCGVLVAIALEVDVSAIGIGSLLPAWAEILWWFTIGWFVPGRLVRYVWREVTK